MSADRGRALLGRMVAGLLSISAVAWLLSAPGSGPVVLTSHDLAGHVVCRDCAGVDPGHRLFDLVRAAQAAAPGETIEAPAGYAAEVVEPVGPTRSAVRSAALSQLPAWTPARCEAFAPLFVEAAEAEGLDPALLLAVAIAESGCQAAPLGPARPADVERGQSCRGNGSWAFGLMQVTTTWHGTARDWCDPAVAVPYAARKLAADARSLGSVDRAIYAYNSGGLQTAEGRRYLRWVGGMLRERAAASSPTFLEWCRVRDADGDGLGTFGLPCLEGVTTNGQG